MIYKIIPKQFNPRFETAHCFCECEGEILLLQRREGKSQGARWGLPGGKVDEGETTVDALIREIREELYLAVPKNAVRFIDKVYVRYPDYDFIFHIFRLTFSKRPAVRINSQEHKDFIWTPPRQAFTMDLVMDGDACLHFFYGIEYITQKNRKMLEKAKTFSHLVPAAFDIIKRMPQPVGQVCGPISTGGTGSLERNLERMSKAIDDLKAKEVTIFDQMPFQKPMRRIRNLYKDERWRLDLLEQFYLPLFESGLVDTLYFLPDWKTSHGAEWEHAQAVRLGIKRMYL
ncbi:MAG: NUDIX domain-containing protein [Candidatus Portnoybacteria bacterium]|nr:NUDIX domain-containing protein [Candidatus Portnoybacteria bacterium]